jgi:rhodanese-related sulfurtransferase
MGWTMAGYQVEAGSTRVDLPRVTPATETAAAERAEALAVADGVRYLSLDDLRALRAKSNQQNVYLIDPRTREEYATGHIPGFAWFPGGQAVQRSDEVMAVRQGHVVFACDGMVRASMTASWFRQMGFPNVYLVRSGTGAWVAGGGALEQGVPDTRDVDDEPLGSVESVSVSQLSEMLGSTGGHTVISIGTSREFSAGHVPGARWVSRSWLEIQIGEVVAALDQPITVTSNDETQSRLAAATLVDMGYGQVSVLEGGFGGWTAAGSPIETGLTGVATPPNDVVPAGTERGFAEMMQYLRWEEELGHKYRT